VPTADPVATLLAATRRIAVVGASPSPGRPSHGVVRRLLASGFEVVPVNPTCDEVLGMPAVPSLRDVEGPVDLVDVFRRPEHAPALARDAVAIGARGLWLQSGVRSAEARRIAEQAGLVYVEDACLAVEVAVRGLRSAG
jgi:predicted CoA-binding protein